MEIVDSFKLLAKFWDEELSNEEKVVSMHEIAKRNLKKVIDSFLQESTKILSTVEKTNIIKGGREWHLIELFDGEIGSTSSWLAVVTFPPLLVVVQDVVAAAARKVIICKARNLSVTNLL